MWQVCIPPVFGNLVCELKKKNFQPGAGLGDPPSFIPDRIQECLVTNDIKITEKAMEIYDS